MIPTLTIKKSLYMIVLCPEPILTHCLAVAFDGCIVNELGTREAQFVSKSSTRLFDIPLKVLTEICNDYIVLDGTDRIAIEHFICRENYLEHSVCSTSNNWRENKIPLAEFAFKLMKERGTLL